MIPLWAALLVVGFVLLMIAAVLVALARSSIAAGAPPVPAEAIEEARLTAETLIQWPVERPRTSSRRSRPSASALDDAVDTLRGQALGSAASCRSWPPASRRSACSPASCATAFPGGTSQETRGRARFPFHRATDRGAELALPAAAGGPVGSPR